MMKKYISCKLSLFVMLCVVMPMMGMGDQDVTTKVLQEQIELENKVVQLETLMTQLTLDFGNTLMRLNRTEKELNRTKEEWKAEKELEWRKKYNEHVAMYNLVKAGWKEKEDRLTKEKRTLWLEKMEEINKTDMLSREHRQRLSEVSTLFKQTREEFNKVRPELQGKLFDAKCNIENLKDDKDTLYRLLACCAFSFFGYFLYVQCVY